MKQLILIEGLPGTGKTTIIQWLANRLTEKGEQVTLLLEGEPRIPSNFYEIAGMPKAEFDMICTDNLNMKDILHKSCLFAGDYVFLRIGEFPEPIQKVLQRWDMGDEMNQGIAVTEYISCALARLDYWVQSMKNECGIILIDSGFMQNPINEILFRGATDIQVEMFIEEMAIRLQPLNPLCIYLHRSDAKEAIRFAEKVKGKEWACRVQDMLYQLKCENHFEHRFELEMKLLSKDFIPFICCLIEDNDWSYAKELITKQLITIN